MIDTRRVSAVALGVNRWWWPATGAAVAAAWVGVALVGTARFPPQAASAAAGTAVLAAAPLLPVAGAPGLTGILALLVLPAAVAEAARGGNAAPLGVALGALGLIAAVAGARDRGRSVPLLALAVGLGGFVAGMTAGSVDFERIRLAIGDRPAAALVLGAAALVLAAVDATSRAERAVVAPVLLGALLAAPALPPLAVVFGWGALAAGAAWLDRPQLALAATAVVAVAAGVGPAATLLAAGAVLAWALDSPIAALCGLPGVVLFADVLAARAYTGLSLAAGAALGATGLALALRFRSELRLDGGRPLALVLAGWLVIAPGTWGFTGASGLGAYDTGAARALATGALVALAMLFRRGGELAWSAGAPAEPTGPVAFADHPVLTVAGAAVATLASVGWLVLSVARLH